MEFNTILTQFLIPGALVIVGSWSSFIWGKKKSKPEMQGETIKNTADILAIIDSRNRPLEEKVAKLERRVDDLERVIREAFKCPFVRQGNECPVLEKKDELDK